MITNYKTFKESLNNIKFEDNHINYYSGQNVFRLDLIVNNETVAYCVYSDFENKCYIDYIESKVKRSGYGKQIIEYLIDKYNGYKNINWGSTTTDWTLLKSYFDSLYPIEHIYNYITFDDINLIKDNNAIEIIKLFYKFGDDAWDKVLSKYRDYKYDEVDLNDLAEIASYIEGSKEEEKLEPDEELPEYIKKYLTILQHDNKL